MHLSGLNSSIASDLTDEIANLKSKAVEFMTAYTTLAKSAPDSQKYPTQYAKWKKLKDYGDKTKESISWITGAIDTTGNVIDSIYYGITHPFNTNPFGLGFLPLIPAAGVAVTGAVIASCVAAMTYFVTQAYEYGKFADATPEVRAALQKQQASGGLTGLFNSVTGLLVVAGVIYFLPKILKGRK